MQFVEYITLLLVVEKKRTLRKPQEPSNAYRTNIMSAKE